MENVFPHLVITHKGRNVHSAHSLVAFATELLLAGSLLLCGNPLAFSNSVISGNGRKQKRESERKELVNGKVKGGKDNKRLRQLPPLKNNPTKPS